MLAENLPVILLVSAIVWIHRYHRFSPASYLFMSVLVVLHTVGGHYTFERVPFGLVTDFFGFERNNYDRFAHFSVGFYAYPVAEILLKKRLVRSPAILAMFPVFAIFTVAGSYEIFEWLYAVSADSSAGIAVLGSQGDIWDAQKDILADGSGSIFATLVFFYSHRGEIKLIKAPA
ncbi:putative membrane protein [Thiogranum longum]|uniref:Putative membrane protein n=2 Tax=Thiogranum longum TaxID=1537524 RepID=A0A4R1HA75_9GAMM|nr:putative membrane protein [Thiogranum longum]